MTRLRPSSLLLAAVAALSIPAVARADQATDAFTAWNAAFLVQNGTQTYYATTDILDATIRSGTWVGALDIAVAEDRYERTHDPADRQLVDDLVTTFIAAEGTDWSGDTWDDDLAWMVIAVLRGYQITGDPSFLSVAETNWNTAFNRGWDTTYAGGGVWENLGNETPPSAFNQPSKCCLSNNPLIKMGLVLYEMTGDTTYLSKCEEMYAWVRSHLFDAMTGQVNECIGFTTISDTTGYVQTSDNAYNSGSFLEAADDLYRVTGTMSYYADALLAITHRTSVEPILHNDGQGESQWGYRFIKGLTQFATYNDTWSPYETWLENNANAAWANRDTLNVTWNDWTTPTPVPSYANVNQISSTDVVPLCTSSAAAIWQLIPPWNAPPFLGSYELKNAAGNLSLDASDAEDAGGGGPEELEGGSSEGGTPVVQASFDGTAGFLWSFVPASGGYYRIQNAGNGLFLSVQGPWAKMGAGVVTTESAPHGQGNDKWLPVANADGTYGFYNLASAMVLDDPGGSTSAGTQFDQWAGNGGPGQAFTLISHVLSPDAGIDAAAGGADAALGEDAASIDSGSGPTSGAAGAGLDGSAGTASAGPDSGTSNGCTCVAARRAPTPATPALGAVASLVALLWGRRRSRRPSPGAVRRGRPCRDSLRRPFPLPRPFPPPKRQILV
jgi:predicted alpha-1,6-mannanase (GH76 family)